MDAALAMAPDHVSAYSLIVEDGTRLATRVRRGELAAPDDDDLADKYLMADAAFTAAGLGWYEVSNWATSVSQRCAHNLLYWQGADWWGVGPGAHSHVGGTRWWNVKHPSTYTARLADGSSPAYAREVLSSQERRFERVLLGTRLVSGHPLDDLHEPGRIAARTLVARGLLDAVAFAAGITCASQEPSTPMIGSESRFRFTANSTRCASHVCPGQNHIQPGPRMKVPITIIKTHKPMKPNRNVQMANFRCL